MKCRHECTPACICAPEQCETWVHPPGILCEDCTATVQDEITHIIRTWLSQKEEEARQETLNRWGYIGGGEPVVDIEIPAEEIPNSFIKTASILHYEVKRNPISMRRYWLRYAREEVDEEETRRAEFGVAFLGLCEEEGS